MILWAGVLQLTQWLEQQNQKIGLGKRRGQKPPNKKRGETDAVGKEDRERKRRRENEHKEKQCGCLKRREREREKGTQGKDRDLQEQQSG